MPSKKTDSPLGEVEELELILDDDLSIDLDSVISGATEVALGTAPKVEEELSLEVEEKSITKAKEKYFEGAAVAPKSAHTSVPTPLSDIEMLITDVDDSVEYLTWVIYGKNGTGKTTLLSTADGVLILAPEEGTLSIRGKTKGKTKKLKIDTWDKIEAVYWLLKGGTEVHDSHGGGIAINTSTGVFVVRYLAIDTVTKLTEVCMRNVVLGDKASDSSRDLLKKTLRDWGDMGEKMKYWLQQFEEFPVQRVWICQENSNSDDVDSDEYSIFPALNKGLRTYVLSEADIIARTYIAKTDTGVQYRLSAAPNSKYVTKDRTSTLNTAAINNPSLEKLYNKVFGTTPVEE